MLTHLSAKVMSSIVGIRAVTQIFITSVNLVLHGNTGAAILARESSSTLAPAIRVCLVLAAKTVRAFGAFTMLVILFTVEFFLTKLECSLVKVKEAPQTMSAVLAAKIALLLTERSSKLAVRSMETIFAVAGRNFVRIGFSIALAYSIVQAKEVPNGAFIGAAGDRDLAVLTNVPGLILVFGVQTVAERLWVAKPVDLSVFALSAVVAAVARSLDSRANFELTLALESGPTIIADAVVACVTRFRGMEGKNLTVRQSMFRKVSRLLQTFDGAVRRIDHRILV